MENNYTLDWNDEINAENAFVLLPEGDYEFAVTKFERGIQEQTDAAFDFITLASSSYA